MAAKARTLKGSPEPELPSFTDTATPSAVIVAVAICCPGVMP